MVVDEAAALVPTGYLVQWTNTLAARGVVVSLVREGRAAALGYADERSTSELWAARAMPSSPMTIVRPRSARPS